MPYKVKCPDYKTDLIRKVWDDELFILFMQHKFLIEYITEEYVIEWKEKFKSGNPLKHMSGDYESINAYVRAIVKLYGSEECFKEIIKEMILKEL